MIPFCSCLSSLENGLLLCVQCLALFADNWATSFYRCISCELYTFYSFSAKNEIFEVSLRQSMSSEQDIFSIVLTKHVLLFEIIIDYFCFIWAFFLVFNISSSKIFMDFFLMFALCAFFSVP